MHYLHYALCSDSYRDGYQTRSRDADPPRITTQKSCSEIDQVEELCSDLYNACKQ